MRYQVLLCRIAIGLIIALSFVTLSLAQSGRRVHKPAPLPIPTPAPQSTTPKKPEEKSMLTFIVGVDRYSGFSTIPLSYYDTVKDACGDRLNDAKSVKVERVPGELSHGDAVARAKAEKEAYVVWLQIRAENIRGDPSRINNLSQLYIEYAVLAPATAKQVAFGHTYQHGYRKGGVIIGPPSTSTGNIGYSEYLLREAAREAGQRILNTLKIPTALK
jgi:hypothetical protein